MPLTLALYADNTGDTSFNWSIVSIDDPQQALASHSVVGGVVSAVLAPNISGHFLICVNVRLLATAAAKTGPVQRRLFKLNVTDRVSEAAHAAKTEIPADEAVGATYTPVDISAHLNGNLSTIFHPDGGGYLEPRPKTCSARIGSDGWSAWTFTYGQGSPAPWPTFFPNASGSITTPQGAQFDVRAEAERNVAFVSQWHNYPTNVTIDLRQSKVLAGDTLWLLISGSTNNMQTRLANAAITFSYADGTAERLELVPPLNYWTLAPVGGVDYDYVRDGFCLPPVPPPTVQLGEANRAMVYSWRAKGAMAAVTVEALSLEVVLGLLAVSVGRAA